MHVVHSVDFMMGVGFGWFYLIYWLMGPMQLEGRKGGGPGGGVEP